MALVSVQNILAPFENKTHLFTIVIIAALFGLWRATGGSVSIRNADVPVGVNSAVTSQQSLATAQPTAQRNVLAQRNTSAALGSSQHNGAQPGQAHGHSSLDALLQPAAPAPQPAKKERPRSALDNIEKTLGMR